MSSDAATEINEGHLAQWLFTQCPVRGQLAEELGYGPRSVIRLQVLTRSMFPHALGPGDIDILIARQGAPENTIAIEVKRVKIIPESFYTGLPGKLQGLKRAVKQANLLSKLRFHRTMLLVVTVTDGRERHGLNFASRGPTFNLVRAIDAFPDREKLSDGIGLAFVEITQPVDKSIEDAGSIGTRLVRRAAESIQPAEVTTAVSAALRVGAQ